MDERIASFRSYIDALPISKFQLRLMFVVVVLLLADGYDTYSLGFVVPLLSKQWNVPPSSFGPIFSAGVLGLTVGALLCTPIADRLGARRILLICTACFAVLSLLTAFVPSWSVLLVLRFATGIALGGAMPCAIALVSEYSPTRHRTLLVAVASGGFALGGGVGALVAATIIAPFGWQSIFLIGGIGPLLLFPLLWRWLPESLPILLGDPRHDAQLKGIISQVSPGWVIPSKTKAEARIESRQVSIQILFSKSYALSTVLIWIVFICNLLVFFFQTNWIPSIVNSSGQTLEIANLTVAMYQVGALLGVFVLSFLCDRTRRPQVVLGVAFCGAAVFCFTLGLAGGNVALLFASACGAGFCVAGAQNAANAFVGNYYPSSARATGVGWALGVGRLGAIVAPTLAGILIGLEVTTPNLFALFALPAVLGAVCILFVKRSPGDLSEGPADAKNRKNEMLFIKAEVRS